MTFAAPAAMTGRVSEGFGNGAPWSSFAVAPPLTVEALKALSPWFLVLHAKGAQPPGSLEDPTGALGLPRTSTGGTALGPELAPHTGFAPGMARWVFRIKRGPHSQFDFISLGRNHGNDILVPDESISRFHAFFRELPWGLSLVDAKSANGTWASGARVPPQGMGDPVPVSSGEAVRFGDIRGVVLDPAGLHHLLQKPEPPR